MKLSMSTTIFLLLFTVTMFGQSYSGPATGSVDSGVVVTTDDFLSTSFESGPIKKPIVRKRMEYISDPVYYEGSEQVFENYIYIEDKSASLNIVNSSFTFTTRS